MRSKAGLADWPCATATRISPCHAAPGQLEQDERKKQVSISLKLTGSFDPVATALRRISEIGTQPERVLTPLGHIILNSTRRRIVDQVTPDGGPFAALNPGYAAAKDGPGILRGRDYQNGLYGSLVTQAEGNVLRWDRTSHMRRFISLGPSSNPGLQKPLLSASVGIPSSGRA